MSGTDGFPAPVGASSWSSVTNRDYRLSAVGRGGVSHVRGEAYGRRVNAMALWHSERLQWLVKVEAHDGSWHAMRHEPTIGDVFDYLLELVRSEPMIWAHALEAA